MNSRKLTTLLALTAATSLLLSDAASASGQIRFTNSSSTNSHYSRTKASQYAVQYAAFPGNTAYAEYGYGGFGDCTNFASQVLRAGNLTMQGYTGYESGADDKVNSWYYYGPHRPERSISWTGADEFRYYWGTKNGVGGARVWQMKVYDKATVLNDFEEIRQDLWAGDLVQYTDGGGYTTHTQIVHSWDANDLYVAQHSVYGMPWASGMSLRQSIEDRMGAGWIVTLRIKESIWYD